jgi:hypothetical protein
MDPNLNWDNEAALRKAEAMLPKAGDLREALYFLMARPRPAKDGGEDPGNQTSGSIERVLGEL